jgi:arginyl-tRNA synthetase
MFEAEQQQLETQIRAFAAENGLPEPVLTWGWIPFSGQWGISTSLFQLAALEARARGEKINVGQRAQELAQAIVDRIGTPAGFERIEANKGYLNLFFSTAEYTQRVVDQVWNEKTRYGQNPRKHERVMVEFSQPNTHKAFHVGHLRSAILGDVLCRILDAAGYDVVRANYPGDMGLHVIKWLWNYMNFHNGEKPEKDITQWMGSIYAEANERLAADPTIETEVRALYARWDRRDPEVVDLWERTRQWSLDGFNEIYEQPGKHVVEELIQKGIAQDERPQGPVIVKLDELLGLKNEKYRVLVVLRSDNTALYATEDLALALQKFNDYPDLVKSYYVVDVRQSLHFQQVFKTLEIAGYPMATQCQHISYELVNLPGNVVMASRDGTVVLLESLIREAIARALAVVEQKNPDLDPDLKLAVAKAVGIGAIKYPMLARDNTKIVTFDWETALDFNGQAAPYIQYAAVRANSILRKAAAAGVLAPEAHDFNYSMAQSEIQLVDLISRLPKEVQRAAAELRPLYISTIAYEIAKAFSDFYNECPVLQTEEPVRSGRLRLVAAVRQALANALALLGITAPEAM